MIAKLALLMALAGAMLALDAAAQAAAANVEVDLDPNGALGVIFRNTDEEARCEAYKEFALEQFGNEEHVVLNQRDDALFDLLLKVVVRLSGYELNPSKGTLAAMRDDIMRCLHPYFRGFYAAFKPLDNFRRMFPRVEPTGSH